MAEFIAALETWFYRGASDTIHDESGLDAFDAWIDTYAVDPDSIETDVMRTYWQNSGSVALNVWQMDDDSIVVKQGNEYAWHIPARALTDMPTVRPSCPISAE